MDMKEKLVELLKKAKEKEQYDFLFGDIDTAIDMPHGAEYYADFLIANGVTVQDNTEISEELLKQLRNAPVTILQEEPTIEVVQEWISVKDRLPDTAERVLVCKTWLGMVYKPVYGYYQDFPNQKGCWYVLTEDGYYPQREVTHWMPLPEPPKEV